MAQSRGIFRLLEALVDGAAAAHNARRGQQVPSPPMRGRPSQEQQQSPPRQPQQGCGGCNTGRRGR